MTTQPDLMAARVKYPFLQRFRKQHRDAIAKAIKPIDTVVNAAAAKNELHR